MRLVALVAPLVASCAMAMPAGANPTTHLLAIDGQFAISFFGFPPPMPVVGGWQGTVSLVAPSEQDGTFAATAFAVNAPPFTFDSDTPPSMLFLVGSPAFTVAGGHVTSADLHAVFLGTSTPGTFTPPFTFDLNGMTARGFRDFAPPDGGPFQIENYAGVLTNVAEPAIFALLLTGVLGLALRRRSHEPSRRDPALVPPTGIEPVSAA